MAKDRVGNKIEVGSTVSIPCKVERVHDDATDGCEMYVRPVYEQHPGKSPNGLYIASGQVHLYAGFEPAPTTPREQESGLSG